MRKTLSPAQKKIKGSPSPGRTTRSTAAAAATAAAATAAASSTPAGRGGAAGAGGGTRRRTATAASTSKPAKPTSCSTTASCATNKPGTNKQQGKSPSTSSANSTTTSTTTTNNPTGKSQQSTNKKPQYSPTVTPVGKVPAKSKLRKVIAGKVRPTSTITLEKHKKKTLSTKSVKKEKDEDVNKEPVEVVIHVKKPKNKVIRSENKTSGVTSGKIGKRKTAGKPSEMKKKLLRKLSGKMEEKLESVVNTILEVAVVAKKVVPKGKTSGDGDIIKTKEKGKKDKKKVKVKEEIKKVEIKDEKKEKDIKENKDTKEVKEKELKGKKDVDKKPAKEIKKEIKVEKKEIKEEKEIKKETLNTQEEKRVKEEVMEDVKESKEDKKSKESKQKSKKPKKATEDVEEAGNPLSPKVEEAVKSPPTKEPTIEEPSTPKSPAELLLVKKKVKLKDDEPKKEEAEKDNEQKKLKCSSKAPTKKKEKPPEMKKESDISMDESKRRMKLFGFWEGPKRHREASLNALAKVHCLYENESRGAMMEMFNKAVTKPRPEKKKGADTVVIKEEEIDTTENVGDDMSPKDSETEEIPKRNLRSAPGMRSVGRCWDVDPLSSTTSPSPTSSSSDEASDYEKKKKTALPQPAIPKEKPTVEPPSEDDTKKKEEPPVKKVRKRRKRCELMMDLKDMVVRKRMASLNASAMLAASYSMEKRSVRSGDESRRRGGGGNRSSSDESSSTSMDVESSDDEVIVSGSSKKVAVIVNQDTDVTITGLYVNSTTRSTRHCSITGMQYRISSTSHTQTESTAVTTETVIHTSDHVSVSHSSGNSVEAVVSPGGGCKTYTPLGALSSMQPPGGNSSSPLVRRHPCSSSAFTAPPPPYHHPHQDIHGYYQPAGPLISHHHLHTSASTSSSLPPAVVSNIPPVAVSKGSPASSGGSESVSSGQQQSSTGQQQPPPEEYRAPLAGYPPPYSYQYLQAPPPPYHTQDCYPPYYHQKYPPSYPARRYWPSPGASSQMVSSEPPYPTQAPLVEPYPHGPPPPAPHYYGYPPGPPAPCYSHSPPVRGPMPPTFIEPPFPTCPCPMPNMSCPKNVHTGPLTGASKGPGQLVQAQSQQPVVIQQPMEAVQQQVPLQPVVLALPPEPSGAIIGPPSPARGSAGMPPPASPALSSTARNPPAWSPPGLLITAKPDPADDECCRQRLLADDVEKEAIEKTEPSSITPPPVQTVVELPPLSDNTVVLARRARPATKRKSVDMENVEPNNRPTVEIPSAPPVSAASTVAMATTTATTAPPPVKRRRSEPAVSQPLEPVVTRRQAKKITKCEALKTLRRTTKSVKPAVVEEKKQLRKKPVPTPPPRPPTPVHHAVIAQKSNGIRQRKETQVKSKKSKTDCKKENGRRNHSSPIEENPSYLLSTASNRVHPRPKWSNGWSWDGEPFTARVFLTSDDNPVMRKCYPAMRHIEGDVIHPKDCVLLRSGPRKQLPFIAKVAAMWDNPEDGEMMVSLLWYYRPEHTEQGRNPSQPLDEIFASRHKDTNSVACIEDKCYVLTYNEYCRYKKNVCIQEAGIVKPRCSVVPPIEGGHYPREDRLPPGQVASDIVFFCRKVYDFRQRRILKNPPLLNNNYNNTSHN